MITLLTDFGSADYFVGAMKGVIASLNPDVCIVDISHSINAYDINAAAFVLLAAYRDFPSNTIHVAIVDPGVGSGRRPILVKTDNYYFVGPDNGLFSYVIERESPSRVYHLTNENYFRQPVCATFHGRDIFAPVAGALSKGVAPEILGEEIEDFKRLPTLTPRASNTGAIEGRIIHIDHFGNCVTNLTREILTDEMIARGVSLEVRERRVNSFRQYFSEADPLSNEVFCVWGSAGFLEIVSFRSSAAAELGVGPGQAVVVTRL